MSEAPAKTPIRLVIPADLNGRLQAVCGRNRTRFILDAVRERVERLEREQLERELIEGYRARAQERREFVDSVAHLYREVLPPFDVE